MLRVSPLEHALVHGEGVGDVALANDATIRSAQGEVDPASLLRLRIADLPRLFFLPGSNPTKGSSLRAKAS